MIRLEAVYDLAGAVFAAVAVLSALDRSNPKRLGNALFWGLFATSFLAGSYLGDLANGALVLAMVAIAGFGGLGRGQPISTTAEQRQASARRLGDWLFAPALTIPAVTLLGALVLKGVQIGGVPLMDPKQATPISLGLGVLAAGALAAGLLRTNQAASSLRHPEPPRSGASKDAVADPVRPSTRAQGGAAQDDERGETQWSLPVIGVAAFQEGRRLLDTVGWAAVLPQMLAALGAVFALAGVGQAVGGLLSHALPADSRLAVVCAYTLGMAAFTMIMGNAFAAFPVMTAGIGLPLIVRKFGGDPAVMSAIGMLSGFCGTLMTPMAANFNLVPAALLDLPDRYAVIKAQTPTALILLAANTALLYFLVFHR